MYTKVKEHGLFPLLVLTFLSLIWGSSFILIKKGLLAFSPDQVGTLRITFACIVLLPIAIKNIKRYLPEHWKKLLVLGLISNLAPAILFAAAESGMSSSLAGMLNALTPVFTIIIGILFFSSKINLPLFIGLVVGFIGSGILSFVSGDGSLGQFNYYAIYVIIATICYGISGNLIKEYVNKIDPVVLISLTMLLVGPLSLIYLLITDFPTRLVTHEDALFSLVSIFILGSMSTAFALAIFNKLIKTTTAVFASSVTYLIPIAAIGWGLFDGEVLFPLHYIGMAIIIAGIYLINKFK